MQHRRLGIRRRYIIVIVLLVLVIAKNNPLRAQTNDDCLMCHEDPELSTVRNGKKVSLFIRANALDHSVHKGFDCTYCHEDAAVEEFPHPEHLQAVNCGNCHDVEMEEFDRGIHGQALRLKELYAPTCAECHGSHNILRGQNPKSPTYKMNIPILCGKCHREGAPVARVYNIPEHNILENYSQDIHGVGLFQKGLIVSASCNDCHGNHLILPHSSVNSSISINNIAATCMKCHARIEEVHTKIIRGELWEKKPGAIPACTSCHIPHKVNKQNITPNISDKSCLACHEKEDVHKTVGDSTISLTVNKADLDNSVHQNISCVKCHSTVSITRHRPCETATRVDCSNCHAETSRLYNESGHAMALEKNDPNAPYCTDCHGTHKAKSRFDDTSPTYRANIPQLCGNCHNNKGKANEFADLHEKNALPDYSSSIHGRGLSEKGLLVSAVCTDCHSSHYILGEDNELSTINRKNIPATCASCHKGIYDIYIQSDHSIANPKLPKDAKHPYPTCVDCHSSHFIGASGPNLFKVKITQKCEQCHEKTAKTYLETYHGKAYLLGHEKAARCSDCHGAHNIYNVNNPKSTIASSNIVKTCSKCHPDANAKFTGYLTHATHHNKEKYTALYYTFWAMTFLLTAVFIFFGIHLLMWIPRSIQSRKEKKKHKDNNSLTSKYFVRRFTRSQRITHIFVILSFLLLALTGMILKFANMEWANQIAKFIGGVEVAGKLHRMGAVVTFGYFGFHLVNLFITKSHRRVSFKKFFFGKNSLMFNLQDIKDFGATIKWFIGKGPKPNYGRWTYWEKFDYMAVFWGVAVIGFSGLILWFPEHFTTVFPGWLINVAQIIHSDEALLAVGFIFTVHFFNTHLRPDAFPMDTVIFTGLVPFEEFKSDRPREYKQLKETGRLKKVIIKKEDKNKLNLFVRIMGFLFVGFGLVLVALIIYSVLFGYK